MPFAPGQSGNPGGRPKESGHIKALARKHTEDAIAVLASILGDPDAKGSERIAAAIALLDRGYGKPTQPVGGDDDLPPISQNLTVHLIKA